MVLGLAFPDRRSQWRLDVVSLLAVIGEGSMSKHAQPLTASWLCLLPRLMPAPQALIRSSRPTSLPMGHAHVAGVRSGNYLQELNYFANLIHPIDTLERYSVRHIRIKHRAYQNRGKQDTVQEIRPKFSALSALTIASTFMTIGLLVWAILAGDAPAFVAILIMSVTSSLVGAASLWTPLLTQRNYHCDVPRGDIVIRTRNGAFIVVECTEEVARELYVGSEDCTYTLPSRVAQSCVGLGTVLLMFGVILVGNSTFNLQLGLGAAYITLNAVYWAAALLPARYNWDLSARYVYESLQVTRNRTYTQALYHAILAGSARSTDKSRSIETQWCRTSGAMPDTPVWRQWLDEVSANGESEHWDPRQAWVDLKTKHDLENGVVGPVRDPSSPTLIVRQPTVDFGDQAPAV